MPRKEKKDGASCLRERRVGSGTKKETLTSGFKRRRTNSAYLKVRINRVSSTIRCVPSALPRKHRDLGDFLDPRGETHVRDAIQSRNRRRKKKKSRMPKRKKKSILRRRRAQSLAKNRGEGLTRRAKGRKKSRPWERPPKAAHPQVQRKKERRDGELEPLLCVRGKSAE